MVCDPRVRRSARPTARLGLFRCHAGLGERGAPVVLNRNEISRKHRKMLREFQLGDRVRLTELGIARNPRTTTRSGVVVALPRPKYRSGTVGVLLDGNKRPTAMHRSYVELDIEIDPGIPGCADGL